MAGKAKTGSSLHTSFRPTRVGSVKINTNDFNSHWMLDFGVSPTENDVAHLHAG